MGLYVYRVANTKLERQWKFGLQKTYMLIPYHAHVMYIIICVRVRVYVKLCLHCRQTPSVFPQTQPAYTDTRRESTAITIIKSNVLHPIHKLTQVSESPQRCHGIGMQQQVSALIMYILQLARYHRLLNYIFRYNLLILRNSWGWLLVPTGTKAQTKAKGDIIIITTGISCHHSSLIKHDFYLAKILRRVSVFDRFLIR